ncbi:MAG TPA: tetratricopeptide repeat protein, partial [Candidatus Didemnitutus sp.]|nr:tetratricopeptide repeat protein [Candidatus Didemnitutus sp.]
RAPRASERSSGTATTRAPLAAPPAPAKSKFPIVPVVLGVVIAALVAFIFLRPAAKPESPPAIAAPMRAAEPVAAPISTVDAKSIAVLPFVDMSQSKDQEYFSDGLSEELLNLLAKVPNLKVTSRSSAFSYKGKEVKLSQVAHELGVAHILEGSVRKSGNRLRITAQLIDARTDTHLWSETYDRPLDDIFAVQDEIAAAVVGQLKVSLLGEAPKSRQADPKAYALFLEARQLFRMGSAESLAEAVTLNQRALEIDPNLTSARVSLARCYVFQSNLGIRSNDEGYGAAREMLNKALAVDPDSAEAHAALGGVLQAVDGGLTEAARHFERALALAPTNTDIMTDAMFFARGLNRIDLNIALGEYVVAHDPVNTGAHASLGGAYIRAGRLEEGMAELRTSLRLAPNRGLAHYTMAVVLLQKGDVPGAWAEIQLEPSETWRLDGLTMIYFAQGKKKESDATLAEAIQKYEKEAAWNIAYLHAYRGEADNAFEWLDKAIAYRDPGLSLSPIMWQFEKVHGDPRWLPFLRKIGHAPEQLAAVKFDVKLPAR